MKKAYQISDDELRLIEQFLLLQLSPEEEAKFQLQLKTDSELKGKTEEVRLMLLGIREVALEEQLNQFHKNVATGSIGSTPSARVYRISKKWLAAASVVIVAGLAIWWFTGRQTQSEKLFAAYFKPDPGLMTAMGNTDQYSFTKAMVEYREGNYRKAIEAWEQLKKVQTPSDTLNYFLGVAYLAIGEEPEATKLLAPIANDSNKPFFKDACWYIGLAYLKKGETEKGIENIRKSEYSNGTKLINEITQ